MCIAHGLIVVCVSSCRVFDVSTSDLLKHWDDTYNFIKEAKYVVYTCVCMLAFMCSCCLYVCVPVCVCVCHYVSLCVCALVHT